MFQALFQIIKQLGAKLFQKGAQKLAEKGVEQVAKRGTERVLTHVLGKALSGASNLLGGKGLGQVGQAGNAAAQMVKGIDNNAAGDAIKQVAGGKKNVLKGIWNVVSGNYGKNMSEVKGTAINNPVDSLRNSAEIDKLNNMNLQPMQSRFSNLGNPASKARMKNAPKESNSLYDILDKIKSSKAGQAGQKLLGGDSYGSKLFLNTLSNMGQQGGFSGSDVGQPDKNFFGMLGNSVAMGLGDTSKEQRQQNFNREQTVLNMAQDFDPSQEMMQQWQPKLLGQINGFKADLVNKMYANRKKGLSGLTSEDMMDTQMQYVNLKKQEMKFQDAVKWAQKSTQEVMNPSNAGKYDIEDWKMRMAYVQDHGEPPADGLMYTPAAKDPAAEFPSINITPSNQWGKASPENGFTKNGVLTDEQRQMEAVAQLNSNPGIRKWAERNGYNVNDQKDQIRFGVEYGKYIEPPVPDEAAKMRYEDLQQRTVDRAEKEKDKLGYSVQNGRVVFTRDRTENVLKKDLENAVGEPLSTSADNAIPIRFENIQSDGTMSVTATVKDADGRPILKQIKIPVNKAKDLVEPFYPGAYDEATKMYKAPKEPTGVKAPGEVKGVDPKTGRLAVFNKDTHEFIRYE